MFIVKLVIRELIRQRSVLVFALLAVMASSSLIVWFVAGIDTTFGAEDDGTKSYLGKYTLALCANRSLPRRLASVVEHSSKVKKIAYASQQHADVKIDGLKEELVPAGMAERQSPTLMSIAGNEQLHAVVAGHWPSGINECAVSTPASKVLGSFHGKSNRRKVELGDKLNVTTDEGTFQLDVVGIVEQKIPKEVNSKPEGMFCFGFGIGIGGRQKMASLPNGSAVSQKGNGRPLGVSPKLPSVFISEEGMSRLCGRRKQANIMFIQLNEGSSEDEFYSELEAECGMEFEGLGVSAHDTCIRKTDKNGILSGEHIVRQVWSVIGIVVVATVFIVFITLSMGVAEKSHCLAKLRAVGFFREQIGAVILLEGAFLGIIGWGGGIIFGWLLLTVLVFWESRVFTLVTISPVCMILSFICAITGAILAAIIPACRAMRIAPMESMDRHIDKISRGKIALSGILSALLLGVIPVIVFVFPMEGKTRLLLFSTVGMVLFAVGVVLLMPTIIAFTEWVFTMPVAALFRLHPLFLSQVLSGSFWRTLGTALALSLGLALFTAVQVWGSSMLNMFWVPSSVPDVLVRFHEGIASSEIMRQACDFHGVDDSRMMVVSVAQPELSDDLKNRMSGSGTIGMNFVTMGLNGDKAFGKDGPLLRLRFVEGSRQGAMEAFSDKEARVCIIPQTVSFHAGLHVGDSISLRKSDIRRREVRKRPGMNIELFDEEGDYVNYRIVGVVEFAWVWFSKCSGVRVSSSRTGGIVFVPYASPLRDFGAYDNEFLWFDKRAGTTHGEISDYMRKIAGAAAEMHPEAVQVNSFAGGTRWDSGINRNFVMVSSNESLNNSLRSRSYSVLDAMSKMPLVILVLSILAVINTIAVSIRSRRREMAIYRACGVTKAALVRMIVAEAIMIGICACIASLFIGLFYSWLALALVDFAPVFGIIAPPFTVPLGRIIPGYLLAIGICTLAGVSAVAISARSEPIAALYGNYN